MMQKIGSWLRATFLVASVASVASWPASTEAAEPVLQSDDAIARFLLPYAPLIFDLSVQAGRSLAQITYGERSFDPIAENFVVSDLHIRRDTVDILIRRLRIGENLMMAEGLAVDTRQMDLPPEIREGLKQLDRETVVGTIVTSLKRDDARSALGIDLSAEFDGVGSISANAVVDGFHVLLPLSGLGGGMSEGLSGDKPTFAGTFFGGSATYSDEGLSKAAFALAAKQSGVTLAQMQNGIATLPMTSVGDVLESLPGGASPALRDRARGWARAVEKFLRKPDQVTVSFNPEEPVPLTRFASGTIDEDLIVALNPSVLAGPKPAAAPPSDAVGAATVQISGNDAIQDREAGARDLLKLADSGNVNAIAGLAGAFSTAHVPALKPEEFAALYKYLLVARALDYRVSDATLASVGAAAGADAIRPAERDANAYFRDKTDAGKTLKLVSADTIGTFTTARLRSLAYDTYEGRGVPRDYTEAYALALVAAADGDPLAISLRDHLNAAADTKTIVIAADEAKTRAAALRAAKLAFAMRAP